MSKKRYTQEFKEQAVRLGCEIGISKASRDLGVSGASLNQWRRKFRLQGIEIKKANETEQEEMRRLRLENSELKKVNNILKMAAAFFSQGHLK
jgi:transposase